MSLQKFFLIPEKNISKFCEERRTKGIVNEELEKKHSENNKPTKMSNLSENEGKNNSNELDNVDENNHENSTLFKEKNKGPNLDLDSTKASSEAPPPPGVPNTKRKRVIEGNSSVGAGVLDVGYKSTKIPKKLNWIQI